MPERRFTIPAESISSGRSGGHYVRLLTREGLVCYAVAPDALLPGGRLEVGPVRQAGDWVFVRILAGHNASVPGQCPSCWVPAALLEKGGTGREPPGELSPRASPAPLPVPQPVPAPPLAPAPQPVPERPAARVEVRPAGRAERERPERDH